MTAPLFFVINPRAGSGRAGEMWNSLEPALRRSGVAFEYELTQGPETATSFVRQALRRGAQTIVAVGGDGTAHEAANGFFLGPTAVSPEASMGILPCGTTDDFAGGLGVPSCADALDSVLHGRIAEIDLGRAQFVDQAGRPMHRYFINTGDLGAGVRSALGGAVLRGKGGFIRQALTTLVTLPPPNPWRGRIVIDDEPPEEVAVVSAVIGLGPLATGGVELLPGAKMDDGRFDILLIEPMSAAELLAIITSLAAGTHLEHRALRHSFARTVRVETNDWPFLELDGEVVGSGPVTFDLLPSALKVHMPR